jgi:hypothetical protein
MRRILLNVALLVLSASVPTFSQPKPAAPSLPWQPVADCAAAYHANWQNRMTGYNRSNDMSNMIQIQSEDYKTAAVRFYQRDTRTTADDAKAKIGSYIAANVDRYVAMDKAGTLEDFIEKCPQLDPEAPN